MTKDEALKLARRALYFAHDDGYSNELSQDALDAIKKALAQPEKATVTWVDVDLDGMVEAFHRVIEAHATKDSPFHNPVNSDAMMALRVLRGLLPEMKQYVTPLPRKPLTDEEIDALAIGEDGLPNSHFEFARAIEAAHGIKE